jgi:hypothetical protein
MDAAIVAACRRTVYDERADCDRICGAVAVATDTAVAVPAMDEQASMAARRTR